MTEMNTPQQQDLLSPREIAIVEAVQVLYGAKVKQAAGELATTIAMTDEQREQFVGNIALKLEGLDFEKRQQVAQNLGEITAILDDRPLVVSNGNGHSGETLSTVAQLLEGRGQPVEEGEEAHGGGPAIRNFSLLHVS